MEKATLSRTAYLVQIAKEEVEAEGKIDIEEVKVQAASRHDHEYVISAGGNNALSMLV